MKHKQKPEDRIDGAIILLHRFAHEVEEDFFGVVTISYQFGEKLMLGVTAAIDSEKDMYINFRIYIEEGELNWESLRGYFFYNELVRSAKPGDIGYPFKYLNQFEFSRIYHHKMIVDNVKEILLAVQEKLNDNL